jgi:hypothetical protein
MSGQILCRVEQSQKSLAAYTRGGFTGPIPRRNLFVPGPFVIRPDSLRDLWISDYEEAPAPQPQPRSATQRPLVGSEATRVNMRLA